MIAVWQWPRWAVLARAVYIDGRSTKVFALDSLRAMHQGIPRTAP